MPRQDYPDKRNTGKDNSQGRRGASGGGNKAANQARKVEGQDGADRKNDSAVRVSKIHEGKD